MSKAKKLGAKVVKEKQEIGSSYYCVLEHPQEDMLGFGKTSRGRLKDNDKVVLKRQK